MTLEELQVIITAKTAGLQSELKNVSKQLKGMETATQNSMKQVQSSVNKATDGITGAAKKLKTVLIALGIGKTLKDSFNIARTYEASLGQVNRLLGQNTEAFKRWVDKNALTFGLAKAQAMQYASIYGNLLTGFLPSTEAVTQYTQELLKASSIIASNTGRTINDVNERIRSGLLGNTESIEDLGVNVNVALLQTTDAFKQLANGRSWDKLSFQTQQQIRLMAILEQTSKKFGDSVQQNTNYRLMVLTAQLKNVALNIGNAFMPIVNAVLPILTTFAGALERVTNTLAIFMNALFGTNMQQIATGSQQATGGLGNVASGYEDVGKEAEKAGKKAKGALASFDEVNQLSFGSGGDKGDSSGGLPSLPDSSGGAITGLPTDPIDSNLIASVEAFKKALEPTLEALGRLKVAMEPFVDFVWQGLKDFYDYCLVPIGKWLMGEGLPRFIDALAIGFSSVDWGNINESLKTLWEAIVPFAINIGEGLLWFWENVLVPLGAWTVNNVVPIFLELIGSTLVILNEVLNSFKPLGEWLWLNFLQPIANWTGNVIIASLQGLTSALQGIGNWMKEHQSVVTTITTSVVGFFTAWKVVELTAFIQMSGSVVGALTAITGAITAGITAKLADKAETIALTLMYAKDFVVAIASSTAALLTQATQFVANKVAMIASTVAQGTMTAATVLWNTTATIGTAVTGAFGAAMAFLTSPITLVIAAIAAVIAVVVLLVKNWDTVKAVAIQCWDAIVDAWNVASDWFNDKVVEPIKKFFDELWKDINQACSNCWDEVASIWKTVSNWFDTTVIQPTKTAFTTFWNGLKQIGIDTWNGIKNTWNTVKTWFDTNIITPVSGAFSTMWNGIKTTCINAFNGIKDAVKTPLNFVIDMINKVVRGVNKVTGTINNIPGVDIGTIREIPRLARGGIVDGATFMGNYIAGEAGKEMIVPLENTSFVDKLATSLGNAVLMAMQFNNRGSSEQTPTEAIFEIDGWEIARAIIPPIRKELKRTGVKLT